MYTSAQAYLPRCIGLTRLLGEDKTVKSAITLRLVGIARSPRCHFCRTMPASHARADAGQGTSAGQQCGMVSVLFDRLMMSSEARAAEDCFYQAYLQCVPATLVFRRSFGDAVMFHMFTIQSGDAGCIIVDAQQMGGFPRPLGPVTNVTCANLGMDAGRTSRFGLRLRRRDSGAHVVMGSSCPGSLPRPRRAQSARGELVEPWAIHGARSSTSSWLRFGSLAAGVWASKSVAVFRYRSTIVSRSGQKRSASSSM